MTSDSTSEREGSYVLPRNLEIDEIEKAHSDVLEIMGQTYDKFVLDAGEVALVDATGVQFLVQLVTTLKSQNCKVSWINDSIQVYQMATELGMNSQFDD